MELCRRESPFPAGHALASPLPRPEPRQLDSHLLHQSLPWKVEHRRLSTDSREQPLDRRPPRLPTPQPQRTTAWPHRQAHAFAWLVGILAARLPPPRESMDHLSLMLLASLRSECRPIPVDLRFSTPYPLTQPYRLGELDGLGLLFEGECFTPEWAACQKPAEIFLCRKTLPTTMRRDPVFCMYGCRVAHSWRGF